MSLTGLAIVASAMFYNVVPDVIGDNEDGCAEAVNWAESVGGGTALYLVHLPSGWSGSDLVMARPLGRLKRFREALQSSPSALPGALLYAGPEAQKPTADAAFSNRLAKIGSSVAATGVRFVLVEGLFAGLSRAEALFCAQALRAGFDAVDPKLAAGFAMSGGTHDCAYEIAAALAGADNEPVVRVDNAVCLERTLKDLPSVAVASQAKIAYAADSRIAYLDDADTSPHNLWSRSTVTMLAKFATSLFVGARGGQFWYVGQRTADGYPVNGAYGDALEKHAALFRVLSASCEGTQPLGVALPLSRKDLGLASANWGEFAFGAFGIPFYATYDAAGTNVCAVMGAEAMSVLSDDDLRRIFRGRVLVDGDAALALTKRGLSGVLGVKAEPSDLAYSCERLKDGTFVRLSRSPSVPRLTPLSNSVEVCSELVRRRGVSDRYEVVAPACVLATNELGGTVATMVYNCRLEPWNIWNEGRRDALVNILERLNGRPLNVRVEAEQDVFALACRQAGKTLVLIVNLGFDPVEPRVLTAPRVREFEVLGLDGHWQPGRPGLLPCGGFAVLRF